MDRNFIPEIAVGSFQVADCSAVLTMATAWAAAIAADARIPAIVAAQYILRIGAEGGNVRWRNDSDTSVAVTGATGNRLLKDTDMIYTGSSSSLSTFQFIQEAANVSKLNVQIFKQSC